QAMEGEQSQVYENLNRESINENHVYELCQVLANEERRPKEPKNIKKRKNKWNKPIIHTVLVLSLIVILLIVILCLLLAHMSTRDTTCTCTTGATTGAIAGSNEYPNFTQWANDIVSRVNQSLPDFNEWSNGNNTNFAELDKQILQTTRDSAQKLINIVNTLSNLQDTSTSTAGVADDILLIAQELLVLHNKSATLPTSCKEIKERQPFSPSGVYLLASTTIGGSTYTAYCNMEELCGLGGGWARLAYLDMTDATQNCPSGFRLYQSEGVRACGRTNSSGGCVSVQFPSNGISYSQICGRVTGYQYSHTDGLHSSSGINSTYLEGVSITRGSPRQHVWSLISGYSELSSSSCPCNTGSSVSVQSFIGNDYFCESGNPNTFPSQILHTSDPLWDGQECNSDESPCCNVPGIPWFHRDYGSNTTTDYIELRVCGDYHANAAGGEDSPVSYYEIYVK
uniref:Fibrinogen C-terminal domain-containing protein n=1 Tax=Amphimedon queenslandica TaxID=400682 RepID=A0A1X7T815_AMPQE